MKCVSIPPSSSRVEHLSISVRSTPLEVVYNVKTMNSILNFFRLDSDVLSTLVVTSLSESLPSRSQLLNFVSEYKSALDLDMQIEAPIIILPEE